MFRSDCPECGGWNCCKKHGESGPASDCTVCAKEAADAAEAAKKTSRAVARPPKAKSTLKKNVSRVAADAEKALASGESLSESVSTILRGLVAANADEEAVAKDYAARVLQGRFRARHNSGNRPEARLFGMLKQTLEAVPDHRAD